MVLELRSRGPKEVGPKARLFAETRCSTHTCEQGLLHQILCLLADLIAKEPIEVVKMPFKEGIARSSITPVPCIDQLEVGRHRRRLQLSRCVGSAVLWLPGSPSEARQAPKQALRWPSGRRRPALARLIARWALSLAARRWRASRVHASHARAPTHSVRWPATKPCAGCVSTRVPSVLPKSEEP